MCLTVGGSRICALDGDGGKLLRKQILSSKFFQVVEQMSKPCRALQPSILNVGAQVLNSWLCNVVLNELQALLAKLATCKRKISLASLPSRASGLKAGTGIKSLASPLP